jgi:hypothetical protein
MHDVNQKYHNAELAQYAIASQFVVLNDIMLRCFSLCPRGMQKKVG